MKTARKLTALVLTLAAAGLFTPTILAQSKQERDLRPKVAPFPQRKDLGIQARFIRVPPQASPRPVDDPRVRVAPGGGTLYDYGMEVRVARYGTPGYRAGLERGDIIVQAGRYKITSPRSLELAVQRSGRFLPLKVINVRTGGVVTVVVNFDR